MGCDHGLTVAIPYAPNPDGFGLRPQRSWRRQSQVGRRCYVIRGSAFVSVGAAGAPSRRNPVRIRIGAAMKIDE